MSRQVKIVIQSSNAGITLEWSSERKLYLSLYSLHASLSSAIPELYPAHYLIKKLSLKIVILGCALLVTASVRDTSNLLLLLLSVTHWLWLLQSYWKFVSVITVTSLDS